MEPVTTNEDDSETMKEKISIVLSKLNDLKDAIQKGNMDKVKTVTDFLDEFLFSEKDLLHELHINVERVTDMDLILSACFHKRTHILYHLLYETQFLALLNDASIDINQVDDQRVAALRYAIFSDEFDMVEMLYDYWCGDTHWSGHLDAGYVINNIQRLGQLLEKARSACQDRLIQKQQMRVNVHCLITFNSFQRDLYENLHKHKPNNYLFNDTKTKAKLVGTMLLNVLRIYDKYSYLEIVRIRSSVYEQEQKLKTDIDDKYSIYFKGLAYIMYEVYFRKLDFNISLLILENINVLRRHLQKRFNVNKNNKSTKNVETPSKSNATNKDAAQLFEEIESTLYHFIYRTSEDWRLYLPKNRQQSVKKNRLGIHAGQFCKLELKCDEQKVYNAPVIFFERKNFKKYVKKLKKVLKNYVTSERQHRHVKLAPGKEELTVFLDDNYLKPIKYMRDHYSLSKIAYYIEALENGKQCDVLMIDRVIQVIGEMLKCSVDTYHLCPFTKALLQTELSVETDKHLHNIREYLSHVDKGQLSKRIQVANVEKQTFSKIQQDLKEILQRIYPILDIYRTILDKSLLESGLLLLDKRFEIIYDNTGYSTQIFEEIPWVQDNKDELLFKKKLACSRLTNHIVAILPKYIKNIDTTLTLIISNNENWDTIKSELGKCRISKIPDYPEKKHIIDITNKLKSKKKMKTNIITNEDLLNRMEQMQDLSTHWMSIKNLLEFLTNELDCKEFENIAKIFKSNIKDKFPDLEAVNTVQTILKEINHWCDCHRNCAPNTNPIRNTNEHFFNGIKELDKNIYTIDKNIKEVSVRIKRDQLILCLLDRIGLLKTTLQYSKQIPMSQHLCKYKRDQEFQFKLEMLLVDIGNILSHCKVRLMSKSAKLLTGIDLGNVLDHGNPFLEVISVALDSNDFSSELLSKAMMFAEDEESIEALYRLFKDNINFDTIKWNVTSAMNGEQKKSLDQFKMSNRWESYLNLIKIKST